MEHSTKYKAIKGVSTFISTIILLAEIAFFGLSIYVVFVNPSYALDVWFGILLDKILFEIALFAVLIGIYVGIRSLFRSILRIVAEGEKSDRKDYKVESVSIYKQPQTKSTNNTPSPIKTTPTNTNPISTTSTSYVPTSNAPTTAAKSDYKRCGRCIYFQAFSIPNPFYDGECIRWGYCDDEREGAPGKFRVKKTSSCDYYSKVMSAKDYNFKA